MIRTLFAIVLLSSSLLSCKKTLERGSYTCTCEQSINDVEQTPVSYTYSDATEPEAEYKCGQNTLALGGDESFVNVNCTVTKN